MSKANSRRAFPGANLAPPADMQYLPGGKAPREVPAGKVLVHNHVTLNMTPDRPIGRDGFRAWYSTAPADKMLEPCDCGWQPKLGIHYRVRQD
jgi:hypothetical protein